MALTAALVDRARTVSKGSTGRKVEGMTRMATLHGPWFRARLFPQGAPQEFDNGRPRVVSSPTLMLGVRDSNGDPILINANLSIEVDSKELGRSIWKVTGDPEPIRKRRRVIGYVAALERVIEHEAAV